PEERAELLQRVTTTDQSSEFKDCDIVIEAVFENQLVKQKVLREAEEYLDEFGLFATNTVSIPISRLASEAERPENYVGIHFFAPAEKVSIVEIVKGENTSDETLARAFDFATMIRKVPIVVKDIWGFYAARVQNTYILEGITMLQEGYPAALVENIGVQSGMPIGPLALADDLGLEMILKYENQAAEHYGSKYVQHPAAQALELLVDQLKRRGKHRKAGFYQYPETGDNPQLWPDLAEHFPVTKTEYDRKKLRERFLFVQVIEAGWCLQEGVIQSRPAANLGSVHGWGFPMHTGGVMRYIYTYGFQNFLDRCAAFRERYGQRFRVPNYIQSLQEEKLAQLTKA
ncbi:MAG: 3-hydroxyacyl-CoA dehydrogenase NAD-binding domain-containing protein, partial [Bacteroidota bacterium]